MPKILLEIGDAQLRMELGAAGTFPKRKKAKNRLERWLFVILRFSYFAENENIRYLYNKRCFSGGGETRLQEASVRERSSAYQANFERHL